MSEVKGYRRLTETEVEFINNLKTMEAAILSTVDAMKEGEEINQRWVSIGRTHIEQGFMALVRSVARPNGE